MDLITYALNKKYTDKQASILTEELGLVLPTTELVSPPDDKSMFNYTKPLLIELVEGAEYDIDFNGTLYPGLKAKLLYSGCFSIGAETISDGIPFQIITVPSEFVEQAGAYMQCFTATPQEKCVLKIKRSNKASAGDLNTLKLENDGEYLILKLGDTELSRTFITNAPDTIPCTDLSITSAPEIALDAGQTTTITYNLQPSDCNQIVQFRSDDPQIASITSKGVVTGEKAGISDINIFCGNHTKTVKAAISEIIHPTWLTGNFVYTDGTDRNGNPAIKLEQNNQKMACVFPQENTKNIFLKTGQRVTIAYNGTGAYYFRFAYAIAPLSDEGFYYTTDWSDRICVANCKIVDDIFGGTESYKGQVEYIAKEDCYIVILFSSDEKGDDDQYSQEELDALNAGLITIRVSPE